MVLGYAAHKFLYNGKNNYSRMMDVWISKTGPLIGYQQSKNAQASAQAQIRYEQYLRQGNERALRDYYRNVGVRRPIKYPEFSYPGQIYRSNTAIARAGYDYDTAGANYTGNAIFRASGLYGIGHRATRWM